MPNTLIRIFDEFSHADDARNALLHAGFAADELQLITTEDEAGPVQGNFYLGNGNRSDPSYNGNYADAVNRGTFILTIATGNDGKFSQASDILDRIAPDTPDVHAPRSTTYK